MTIKDFLSKSVLGRWEVGFSAVCKKRATAQLFPRETPRYLIVPAPGLTLQVNPDQPASNTTASASLLPSFKKNCPKFPCSLVGMPPKRVRLVCFGVAAIRAGVGYGMAALSDLCETQKTCGRAPFKDFLERYSSQASTARRSYSCLKSHKSHKQLDNN